MNTSVTLGTKEKKILERVAWGASYKEVASFFKISVNTVDNTLRHIKTKIGLSKVAELSAWWFCTNYNISFDLSPIAQKNIATLFLGLFVFGEVLIASETTCTIRLTRRTRTEYRVRRLENYINQPYII